MSYNPSYSPKKKRRWPWVVGGVFAFFLVVGSCNAALNPTPVAIPSAPVVPSSTFVASAVPSTSAEIVPEEEKIVLPQVKGRNGSIVQDELVDLGLTNVKLASRDNVYTVVVLPENWTAVKIEPAAGSKVRSDQAVVVTLTKNS